MVKAMQPRSINVITYSIRIASQYWIANYLPACCYYRNHAIKSLVDYSEIHTVSTVFHYLFLSPAPLIRSITYFSREVWKPHAILK